jgi:hypothetical protein
MPNKDKVKWVRMSDREVNIVSKPMLQYGFGFSDAVRFILNDWDNKNSGDLAPTQQVVEELRNERTRVS